jgi:SAM-dependent methyltransferase
MVVPPPTGYRATSNQMGWTNEAYGDPAVDGFVALAASAPLPVVDIGAGHGAATAAAIRVGARVVAVEIHDDHLDAIRSRVGRERADRLTLVAGRFPEAVRLPAGAHSAVLLARVLHFFDGPRIEACARTSFALLAPGGRVFVSAETPFRGNMRAFLPTYEARRRAGDPWPGIVDDTSRYFSPQANLPPFMNFLDEEVLRRVFAAAGFEIEKAYLFERPHLPDEVRLDGREGVGLVAVKRGGPGP